jgi:hypothetical protein
MAQFALADYADCTESCQGNLSGFEPDMSVAWLFFNGFQQGIEYQVG